MNKINQMDQVEQVLKKQSEQINKLTASLTKTDDGGLRFGALTRSAKVWIEFKIMKILKVIFFCTCWMLELLNASLYTIKLAFRRTNGLGSHNVGSNRLEFETFN